MSNVKSLTREIQNFNIEINWKKSDKYQKIILYTRPQWREVAKNDQAATALAEKTAEYFLKNLDVHSMGVKQLTWMFIQEKYHETTGFLEGLKRENLFKASVLKNTDNFEFPFIYKNISNVHTALIQIFFGETDLLDQLGFLKS